MAIPLKSVENSDTPALYAGDVIPSDSSNLSSLTRALYIGTGGNLAAVMADDSVVVFSNLQSGQILPIRVKRVNVTNTTAGNIVALF